MTVLTEDYQIEWNGLLMGTDTPYDIVGINGAGIPSVRSNDIPRLGDHGTYPARLELLNPRTFNFEIDIIGTELSDLFEKVNAFKSSCLPSEDIRPLSLRLAGAGWGETYDATTIAFGFARQMTANIGMLSNATIQKAYLQVECPDPRIYAEQESGTTIDPVAPVGGGWEFPWEFPWTFGASTTGTGSVVSTGPFISYYRMVINGPVTNPRIQNLTTGEFIQINTTVESGSTLELNFRDKTALLDGSAERWNFRQFGSTWFSVRPGSNPLQYTVASGSGQLEVYWRDAWL